MMLGLGMLYGEYCQATFHDRGPVFKARTNKGRGPGDRPAYNALAKKGLSQPGVRAARHEYWGHT